LNVKNSDDVVKVLKNIAKANSYSEINNYIIELEGISEKYKLNKDEEKKKTTKLKKKINIVKDIDLT
jgi:Ser-tRNA(Ala) deacylase AlaX